MSTTVAPFRSACFYSTNNGATVSRKVSAQEEKDFPLPNGITNIFRFDEKPTNNAALLTLWASNSATFTMSGSAVLVSGQAAEFDPPGLLFRALQNAAVLYAKMESTPDALTREEQAQIAAIGFRALNLI